MKRVIFISAMTLLALVVLGGLGAAYLFLGPQERGMIGWPYGAAGLGAECR